MTMLLVTLTHLKRKWLFSQSIALAVVLCLALSSSSSAQPPLITAQVATLKSGTWQGIQATVAWANPSAPIGTTTAIPVGLTTFQPYPTPLPQPTKIVLGDLISPLPTPTIGTEFDVRDAALTAVQLYFPNMSDKFDLLLQRKVTSNELPSLGLHQINFLQEPPLELVLLQGEFNTSSMGRGALGQPAKYLIFIFDLDTRTITYMLALTKGDTIQPLLALAAQVTPVAVTPVPATSVPATLVPATSVPATLVPATLVPAMP